MADGRGGAFGRGESCTPVIPVPHPTLDAGSVLADYLSSNIVMLPFLLPQSRAATKKLKNDINNASGNLPKIKTHGHPPGVGEVGGGFGSPRDVSLLGNAKYSIPSPFPVALLRSTTQHHLTHSSTRCTRHQQITSATNPLAANQHRKTARPGEDGHGRYGMGGGRARAGGRWRPRFRMYLLQSMPDGAGDGTWYPPSHEPEEDEYFSIADQGKLGLTLRTGEADPRSSDRGHSRRDETPPRI
ncbi:hypothetical protein NUW54_g12666 [Trametes sanguinea]|uniref:Uncharacterized protein n=1 Tax=Trametes sanguinea TaxID=158606 RepID=A0ACC1MUP4_9APHY|nr:hypothetical protein NUW54_g12666 [Trametes sanguinea]